MRLVHNVLGTALMICFQNEWYLNGFACVQLSLGISSLAGIDICEQSNVLLGLWMPQSCHGPCAI